MMIPLLPWSVRFKRAARRNAGRSICFQCFTPLNPENAHEMVLTSTVRVSILCTLCNFRMDIWEKVKRYRYWFDVMSGMPMDTDMWELFKARISEDHDERNFGL